MADVGFVKRVLDAIGSALGPIGHDLHYIWEVWQTPPIESTSVKAQAG